MNDFDATLDLPESRAASIRSTVPGRPGVWRVISLLAVIAAVAVTVVSVLQARDASNVAVPDREPVALEEATVTVGDLAVPTDAEVAVLGLPDAQTRRSFDADGTTIDLPEGMAAMLALFNADGSIVGLAVVPEGQDRTSVQITARSTAQSLLLVTPGILRPNLSEAFANLSVIESDAAFEKLVTAIQTNPNISQSNDPVEQAYSEIADRLPVQRPASDQGCDSVIARNAYAAAGACVQPKETGVVIANEQDRWALIYSGTEGFTQLCATISPTNVAGDDVLIPSEQCEGESLMVAPGPVTNQGDIQPIVDQRVRTAAAVNVLFDYTGPFADLAGASAGFTADSVSHLRRNSTDVVGSLAVLNDTHPEFAAAMDVSLIASTALDRHVAAVSATRLIIEAADTTTVIPQRSPGDTGHLAILDFFIRSGERMVGSRTDWRWEANAVGMVDFGGGT